MRSLSVTRKSPKSAQKDAGSAFKSVSREIPIVLAQKVAVELNDGRIKCRGASGALANATQSIMKFGKSECA